MFPHRLTDRSAFDIAQALVDGFNRHYRLFRATTAQAKQRFERADWHGQQRAQASMNPIRIWIRRATTRWPRRWPA